MRTRQLRVSERSKYSNPSRDRQGALFCARGRQTLPDGRGSDWGFMLVHFCLAHPAEMLTGRPLDKKWASLPLGRRWSVPAPRSRSRYASTAG